MSSSKSKRAGSGRSSVVSASISSSPTSSSTSVNTTTDRDSPSSTVAESPSTNEDQHLQQHQQHQLQKQPTVPPADLASSPSETPAQQPESDGAASQAPAKTETATTSTTNNTTKLRMASAGPVLAPPRPEVLRKKSKLNRLSSFFPSLISHSSSDSNTLRKSQPHSKQKEKSSSSSTLADWEAQLKSRFDSSSTDKLALDSSLSLDGKAGHKSQSSLDVTEMGRLKKPTQAPPPLPTSPAPPLPPKTPEQLPITPSDPGFNFTETQPSPKLTKARRRSSSLHDSQTSPPKQNNLAPRALSPPKEPRGRSASAQPSSSTKLEPGASNRQVSATASLDSRPTSSNGSQSPTRDMEKRGRLRKSWFGGGRSRSNSTDIRGSSGGAWTLGPTKADYNTSFLEKGERVPELWNESGNVLVYLHPKASGKGPSFKVMSFVTDYSLFFQELIEAEVLSSDSTGRPRGQSFSGRGSLSVSDAERYADTPPSPPLSDSNGEAKLYLSSVLDGQLQPGNGPQPDLERLISLRNMFALLTGQPLVGNKAQPTVYAVLMRVANHFAEYDFTSVDGSTFGDSVDMSFGFFMESMAIADVRHSREKTLEALLLGERMKSWELYNEAFSHAVGKYTALRELNSPIWDQLSEHTRQRLDRGHFELLNRQNNINNRLENFEFPALFSGLANSQTQYKNVKFGRWKSSFGRMRSFVLGYYKSSFGSWPPKARSKKNPFTESGLNRQVLKILYSDLCALYDLIVDRTSLTPRSMDSDKMEEDENDPMSALRRILTEFDMSSPPVLPPIPYDTPRRPDFRSVKENYYELPVKEQKRLDNNYQPHEFLLILSKSYDFETLRLKLPFLEQFTEFEEKEAKGKPISEIADQRIGYFLFLYVVIQSLPMLVVDAPGLKFTEGVEYFLCQPPKGQPPWLGDAAEPRKRWYEVSGGAGYVELSEDTIEFSIEGIYHRSHCWVAAKQWEAGMTGGFVAEPDGYNELPPLEAPQSVFADNDPSLQMSPRSMDRSESPTGSAPGLALRQRNSSPGAGLAAPGRPGYRSSVALGLEPVAMPGEQRRASVRTSRVFTGREGSIGPRPTSVMMGRSRSSSNMHGMAMAQSPGFASPDSGTSSRQDTLNGGSTFDDILKDMDSKPKKKKSFF